MVNYFKVGIATLTSILTVAVGVEGAIIANYHTRISKLETIASNNITGQNTTVQGIKDQTTLIFDIERKVFFQELVNPQQKVRYIFISSVFNERGLEDIVNRYNQKMYEAVDTPLSKLGLSRYDEKTPAAQIYQGLLGDIIITFRTYEHLGGLGISSVSIPSANTLGEIAYNGEPFTWDRGHYIAKGESTIRFPTYSKVYYNYNPPLFDTTIYIAPESSTYVVPKK